MPHPPSYTYVCALRPPLSEQESRPDPDDRGFPGHRHRRQFRHFQHRNALLLHPLPYRDSDRLAAVWLHSPGIGIFRDWPSPGQYMDLRTGNRSFEEMALAQSHNFTLTGRNQPDSRAI
jgi:hypothetical protein